MTTRKKPTAAQLAARKLFAERAKAGTFKKKRATKKNPIVSRSKDREKITVKFSASEVSAYTDGKVNRQISFIFWRDGSIYKYSPILDKMENTRHADMIYAAAERKLRSSVALPVFENPSTKKRRGPSKVNAPSQITRKKPTARLKARRAKNTVKGMFPNPATKSGGFKYLVQVKRWSVYDQPWKTIATFAELSRAKEYAKAVLAIKGQIHGNLYSHVRVWTQ